MNYRSDCDTTLILTIGGAGRTGTTKSQMLRTRRSLVAPGMSKSACAVSIFASPWAGASARRDLGENAPESSLLSKIPRHQSPTARRCRPAGPRRAYEGTSPCADGHRDHASEALIRQEG